MNDHRALWSRVFTYISTPTKDDGETVDEGRLRQVIDYQIEHRVDGICVLGSTGGNGSFSDEEMRSATAIAAEHAAGRISVIAGTGARTTSACIALSRHAQEVGCDAVMILPVSYWSLAPDEVFKHYDRVAGAIDIPICVYNNPWTTGVDMKPGFLARLTKLKNVSCIKESTGDLSRITAIRRLTRDKVTIVAGWESSSLQAFMAGATGWAPVCTNFVPDLAMQFFQRCESVMRSMPD
jgi:4-hydroxy-tetrahydrodipicolinate synthase